MKLVHLAALLLGTAQAQTGCPSYAGCVDPAPACPVAGQKFEPPLRSGEVSQHASEGAAFGAPQLATLGRRMCKASKDPPASSDAFRTTLEMCEATPKTQGGGLSGNGP